MRVPRVAIVVLLLAACAGAGPDQSAVVDALADQGLVPQLGAASADLDELAGAVAAFCSERDAASLAAARDAWARAKSSWEAAELAVYYGPATMLSTLSKVDYTPISPEGIEELLGSETPIDYDYIDNRSASTRRGLGGVEYVLFASDDVAGADRSCEYLVAASSVAADAAEELAVAWTTAVDGAEPFQQTFTSSMDSNDSISDVVGAYVETLKRQTLFELGMALGISSPEPNPDALPEGRARAGAAVFASQLDSIGTTLRVGDESSLIELIRSRSDDVAERIDTLVAGSSEVLDGVDGPMAEFVAEQPDAATDLYERLSELNTLFESDVVSLLDLTLGFCDSDGDSG